MFNKRRPYMRQQAPLWESICKLSERLRQCGTVEGRHINPLKTKRRLLYLKTHSVPRNKHSLSRL